MAQAVAVSKTNELRQDLLAEQRRLAKLWDAFKKQEDEYRAIEKERDDLWTRVQEMEKASSAIGDPTKTYAQLQTLERENEKLRRDVSELGEKLDSYRAQFNEEQERLAKLFKVYEDAESERARAVKEVDAWQKWYEAHAKTMPRAVASTVSRAGGGLTPKQMAQRKYAAGMKRIRARATKAKGGKGPIKGRGAAKRLRSKLGVKA